MTHYRYHSNCSKWFSKITPAILVGLFAVLTHLDAQSQVQCSEYTISGTVPTYNYIASQGGPGCTVSPIPTGTGNVSWTGWGGGFITYTFNTPQTDVSVWYTFVNNNDVGTMSINGGGVATYSVVNGCGSMAGNVLQPYSGPGGWGDILVNVQSTLPFTVITLVNTGGQSGHGTGGCNSVVFNTSNPCSVQLPPDTTLCAGSSLLLDASTLNATYLWQDNSTGPTFNVTQPGTHWVEISVNGCVARDSIIVDYYPSMSLDLGNDSTFCNSVSHTLSANTTFNSYLWSNGATTQSISINQPGTYWLQAEDNGCYVSDTINLFLSPLDLSLGQDTTLCAPMTSITLDPGASASNYLWNDGSTSQTLTISAPGIYSVVGTEGNCTDSASIEIMLDSLTIDLGPDTTLCVPISNFTLDAGSAPSSYLWNDGSTNQTLTITAPGVYTVIGTNANCADTSSIEIFGDSLVLDLGPDTILCPPINNLVLNPGGFATSYLWNDGSTGTTLTISSPGTYSVFGSDGNCTNQDTIVVAEYTLEPFFSPDDIFLCLPGSADFTDESVASNTIIDWYWTFENDGNSSVQNPTHSFNSTGIINVTLSITDNQGCIADTTIEVAVSGSQTPQTTFGFNPSSVLSNQTITFNNQSTGADNWYWDFGDGSNSTLQNPSHVYETGGTFTIMLISTNVAGCTDTSYQSIFVDDEILFYAPNTFTPNEDEYNNTWIYFASNIDEHNFSMEIYNRWGQLIWESSDPNIPWNGIYQGEIVPTGVYTWKATCKKITNDDRLEFIGHINVLK